MTETHPRTSAESGADIIRRDQLARRIEAAVTRARAVLLWEAVWPCLIWPVGVCFAFVAVSWLGLWLALSDAPRLIGLTLFGLGFLASLWPMRRFRYPAHVAALARIETASGLEGRPLAAFADTLPETPDAATHALWRAHRQRQEARLGTLRAGFPDAGIDRADRYGLRLGVALLLFVGYFAAGDARWDRLGSAFRSLSGAPAIAARLDVWVTPPDYTGLPAALLTGDKPPATEPDGRFRVPRGSTVTVRTTPLAGDAAPDVVLTAETGKPATLAPKSQSTATPDSQHAGPVEFEAKLTVASDLAVTRSGRNLGRWRFTIVPDLPPTIRFIGTPEQQASGTLKLTYEVTDDYGVVSADAHFDPIVDPAIAAVTGSAKPHPLIPPPDFSLSLPSGHPKSGQSTAFRDLTAHPWAGGPVHLTLVARDDLGQEGRSETIDVQLPARTFTKPLARALVEQRRALALDTGSRQHVEDAIDALLIAPELFYPTSGLFLSMTEIRRALRAARTDEDLKGVVDLIWQVATGIEDGNLSDAQKAVRDAEEALRNALDRGASQEEIAKLTQDLREAMNRLMNELAQAQRRAPGLQRPLSQNQKVLREQDLRRMLDRIENLAKTGSRDAARQMLSEMQRMLENLQQGNAGDQGDQQQNEANDLLDQLGEMIQRQQQLMDKTHRLDRNGDDLPNPDRPDAERPNAGEQQPMSPEEMQQALRELQQNQNALRKSLRDLEDKLAQQGFAKRPGGNRPGQAPGANGKPSPGQPSPGNGAPGEAGNGGPFGPAGNAMEDAGKSLGDGDAGNAVDAQGRAIDALRDGAKQLLDQMAQQQPGRQGPGGQVGDGNNPGDDPLGRPRRNSGPQDTSSVKVPDEIDTQRARQVLEEIRRRLSEPLRPSLELDYLRRLLEGQ